MHEPSESQENRRREKAAEGVPLGGFCVWLSRMVTYSSVRVFLRGQELTDIDDVSFTR